MCHSTSPRSYCSSESAVPVLALALQILALAAALQPSGAGASPRTGVVEVQGVRLQYLDWGGQGEPLVLVPARCETPFVFGDLVPLLLNRFRVLGVTARGCGASGLASDGYTLDLQIHDLIGFLDAMEITRHFRWSLGQRWEGRAPRPPASRPCDAHRDVRHHLHRCTGTV
jgi:hypothetical protein